MKFNYRNLSKSLICMLMPIMAACGGKSNEAPAPELHTPEMDSINEAPAPELHTPEMDSIIARYNHDADSMDMRQNTLNAAATAWGDIYNRAAKDYRTEYFAHKDSVSRRKLRELLRYTESVRQDNWDSAYISDWETGYLSQRRDLYINNPTLEAKRPAKTALESISMQCDSAAVAERCYSNALKIIVQNIQKRHHDNELIHEYQTRKVLELADSLANCRVRHQQLLAKKAELQNAK